ncbi:MAG: lamin tail domain-containing protein [Candidatus Kariarchaeaceae archaeon]
MKKNPKLFLIGCTTLFLLLSTSTFLDLQPISNDSIIRTSISQSSAFKVMVYNVEASGQNVDWKEVVKEENADVFIAIETGDWDDASGDGFDVNNFTDLLNEFNSYFSDELPYSGVTTQGIPNDTSGETILSRFPIVSSNQIADVTLDNGTAFDVSHDFLDVELSIYDTNIHIIAAHLKCCPGADNEEKRELAQEGIINYMDGLGQVPIIYAGDLNSFSPEDIGLNDVQTGLEYGPCTMLVDPNDPTYGSYASTIHLWKDVHRELNSADLGITYASYDSRIDFIYVNDFFFEDIINSTTGDTTHASTGSDHYSIDVFIEGFISTSEPTGVVINEVGFNGLDSLSFEIPGSPDVDVIFTEVVPYDETSNYTFEFIELYNPSDLTIDLTGWKLQQYGASHTIDLSGSITAHDFYIIGRSDNITAWEEHYSFSADAYGDIAMNGGEYFELIDVTSTVKARAGEESNTFNDNGIISWELKNTTLDTSLTSNWAQVGTPSPKSFGSTINGTFPEIAPQTIFSERDEYFVLYNPTDELISLNNWVIGNGEGVISCTSGMSIDMYSYLIFAKDADSFHARFNVAPNYEWNATWGPDQIDNSSIPNVVLISGSLNLTNTGGYLYLDNEISDTNGKSMDIVVWGIVSDYSSLPEGYFLGSLAPTSTEGQALRRITPGDEGTETAENTEDLIVTFQAVDVSSISPPPEGYIGTTTTQTITQTITESSTTTTTTTQRTTTATTTSPATAIGWSYIILVFTIILIPLQRQRKKNR